MLKKGILSLLCLNLFNLSSSFALSPNNGVYGGLNLGASYVPALSATFLSPFIQNQLATNGAYASYFQQNGITSTVDAQLNYSNFGQIGGQLGYRWDQFRLELEYFYNQTNYGSIQVNNKTILSTNTTSQAYFKGATTTNAGFVNFLVDMLPPLYVDSNFAPFIGVGVGYAYLKNDPTFYLTKQNVSGYEYNKTRTKYAGQVMVGALWFMDDFSYFGLDFRYFSTGKLSGNLPNQQQINIFYQILSINLTYNASFEFG
jgi:hypothetical protein